MTRQRGSNLEDIRRLLVNKGTQTATDWLDPVPLRRRCCRRRIVRSLILDKRRHDWRHARIVARGLSCFGNVESGKWLDCLV